jgi:hypothetical protein
LLQIEELPNGDTFSLEENLRVWYTLSWAVVELPGKEPTVVAALVALEFNPCEYVGDVSTCETELVVVV